jgi:hypothetical protein
MVPAVDERSAQKLTIHRDRVVVRIGIRKCVYLGDGLDSGTASHCANICAIAKIVNR